MRNTPLNDGYTLALDIGGRRFVTPVIDGLANEGPDPAMAELLGKVLPMLEDSFLDIGANVGQTLLAMRAAAPDMPYVGLEPNISCAAYMRTLVRRNGLSGTLVVPVALMERACILQMSQYSASEIDPSATLVADFRPEKAVAGTLHVPAFPWAEIEPLMEGRRFGFIKIDVEGAELEVLREIAPLLRSSRPWLAIEILPAYSADYANRLPRQEAIEAILKDASYEILRIKRDVSQGLSHLEHLDTIGIHDVVADSDYLMVPSEAMGRLSVLPMKPAGTATRAA
ncbi:FkbM family methyltransferase [Roseivivax jejudonensis]|uniref:FkbM family methyltransferase n=1 Tax=Roseivivax jejudonensis TaxID=1529041 RepID=UPI001356332E|nr:FkbM family methyltransferase [Roseivivax jejudonensis]